MLKLITGGFYSRGDAEITEEIKKRCQNGKRSFLIVPEQQTVIAEGELADALPKNSPLYCEATNFTRFADTVARSLGGLTGKNADSLHRALIIYRAITELGGKLKTVGKAGSVTSGTVNKTIGAIRKTETLNLTPEDMLKVCADIRERTSDSRLADKLQDLSLITVLYKEILKDKYKSSEDSTVRTAKKLREDGARMLSGYHVYIKGFTSFTEPQYELISVLLSLCDVTVFLGIPTQGKEQFEFTELRQAGDRLRRIAAIAGCDVMQKRLSDTEGITSPLLASITTNIWRTNAEIDDSCLQNEQELRIFLAEDPYDECDFVASDIKRRIMDGDRYFDFAVIAREIESYEGIIGTSFSEAGLPLFVSSPEPLDSYELIRMINAAYRVINTGFSRSSVISFAKCSLSGLSAEEADELELYCERWQITGSRFTDGEIWNMNPDGFSNRRREGADEKLLRISAIRDKLINPLSAFAEESEGELTVKEFAEALVKLLIALRCEERLLLKSEELKLLGCREEADGTSRIYGLVIKVLDAAVEIMGDKSSDSKGFANILSLAFSEVSIGQIPSFLDQVSAGSANTVRFPKKKHIYIIGAAASVFPKRVSDDGYFDDGEIERLRASGLPIEPEQTRRSAMEYYYFCRALSLASESVTVLCPVRDGSLAPLRPSEAIDRIINMTGGFIEAKQLKDSSLFSRTYCADYALKNLRKDDPQSEILKIALERTGHGRHTALLDSPIRRDSVFLKGSTLKVLYPADIALTQSRLDTYSSCPMRYFCQYNLKLDGGERAEWGTNNIGTFIHAVLENFFRIIKEDGREAGSLTESEVESITRAAAEKYTAECFRDVSRRTQRMELLIKRLSRYAMPIVKSLCEEFSSSRYQPVFFELAIEKDNPDAPTPASFDIDGKRQAFVFGTIDRVDSFTSGDKIYLRVVDYKTGSKTFSPGDLERGENLQMFLYLKALTESQGASFKEKLGGNAESRLVPAGVMYVKADISDVTVASAKDSAEELIKANQTRLGMLLDDEESLLGMNRNFLPIKYTKGGTPTAASQERLYDEEGWKRLSDTVSDAVARITSDMLSGKISAEPMKKGGKGRACEYCAFKPICRNSNVF